MGHGRRVGASDQVDGGAWTVVGPSGEVGAGVASPAGVSTGVTTAWSALVSMAGGK